MEKVGARLGSWGDRAVRLAQWELWSAWVWCDRGGGGHDRRIPRDIPLGRNRGLIRSPNLSAGNEMVGRKSQCKISRLILGSSKSRGMGFLSQRVGLSVFLAIRSTLSSLAREAGGGVQER